MRLLAIDPGCEQSAYVIYDTDICLPVRWAKLPNDDLLRELTAGDGKPDEAAIEMVASYGMAVGATVFETVWWTGRLAEAWRRRRGRLPTGVLRREVKLHLCGTQRAKDTNIRQALIDRYGPGREKAVGRKASPGPLYGMKADCWSALAVAITAVEAMGK